MIGMARHWFLQRGKDPLWSKRFALFSAGATLCLAILGVNIYFKVFYDYFFLGQGGGWMTVVVTSALAGTCFLKKGLPLLGVGPRQGGEKDGLFVDDHDRSPVSEGQCGICKQITSKKLRGVGS